MIHGGPSFDFQLVAQWPSLAWLARCGPGNDAVTVYHGAGVEVRGDWFCEAVWDGPFADGDFDRTDIVAGSGGRIRDGRVVFVSSGSTVDRLQSLRSGADVWVSNSLACLLAVTGAALDRSFPDYPRQLTTIVAGIRSYQALLPTTAGPVRLTYFDNLVWDGSALNVASKPGLGRDFSSFERYYSFLLGCATGIAANMDDDQRRIRYEFLSTASSGYDSTAATVIGRHAGCARVLCVAHTLKGGSDSGLPIAQRLGMTAVEIRKDGWRELPLPEPPFIAADARGGDVFFRTAEAELRGKVLLTGYHGGRVWSRNGSDSEDIVRGDVSGLSLTEYRLVTGTIHCPVAFWGSRQAPEIGAISRSAAMSDWFVPGDYSRPIPRRIVESAGVDREMFGMQKRASWVNIRRSAAFMSDASIQDYLSWLTSHRGEWLRRGRVPPIASLRLDYLDVASRKRIKEWVDTRRGVPRWAVRVSGLKRVVDRVHGTPTPLRRYLTQWAMEHHTRTYDDAIQR